MSVEWDKSPFIFGYIFYSKNWRFWKTLGILTWIDNSVIFLESSFLEVLVRQRKVLIQTSHSLRDFKKFVSYFPLYPLIFCLIGIFLTIILPLFCREKIYLEGGVLFVSFRIIVVDFLKKRLPIEHVTGILVNRAHRTLENCHIGFTLRLYRQNNKVNSWYSSYLSSICLKMSSKFLK